MYKALMVYPEYPETFWSFKYALKFILKKAANPPLGLLTVASMLPDDWEVKLVDMNVRSLTARDIQWADYVMISAMDVQKPSVIKIIETCRKNGVKMIAGGPLFTTGYRDFPEINHFILNEAEITLPLFLHDLEKGNPQPVYTSSGYADISLTPVPRWDLINIRNYANITIQYSRGCPFDCDFCGITLLYGRKIRTKSKEQVIDEMEHIYRLGWKDDIFFVDDNFTGNKAKLRSDILPALIDFQVSHKISYTFTTQASIELSDDSELMEQMSITGFNKVFVGIESPNEDSLHECSKRQNEKRDMLLCVKKMQHAGIEVAGGFIVGFDNDPRTIFESQIKFIQKSGIITAMVGLLHALPETRLYNRLLKEKRVLNTSSGNNTDFSMNFVPKMKIDELIKGYKDLLGTIYSPREYYARVRTFLKEFSTKNKKYRPVSFRYLWAFFKSVFVLGIWGRTRVHYWKLLIWTAFRRPHMFTQSIAFAIFGFHFTKVLKLSLRKIQE